MGNEDNLKENNDALESIRAVAEEIIRRVDSILEYEFPVYQADVENFEENAVEISSLAEDMVTVTEEE